MKTLIPAIVICSVIAALGNVSIADEPVTGSTPQAAAASEQPVDAHTQSRQATTGMAAMEKAAKSNKYLFALFRKEDNDQTTAMRQVLDEVMKKVADRADAVQVDVSAASEKDIVEHFEVAYAPLPLLLAIAPNGAVTGGFPGRVEARRLMDAFASPGTAKCLKAFQDRKLVFLCVQNDETESAKKAMQGVHAFKRDERFAKDTQIIVVDPSDKAESQLLSDLEIDAKSKEAVTVLFAPPGRFVGRFHGATNLDDLVSTLVSAMSGCGSCGPGGCGSCGPGGCGH
ncbi:MAG: hypothetical protein ISR77_30505 [Pirellulaceae bacterium]|nr:hypothetical protein [Pirellulaceae bacterium]